MKASKKEDGQSNGSGDSDDDGDNLKKFQGKRSSLGSQIVAFYTDIEHKVKKIKGGTRIVLQFDVNVADGKPSGKR